MDLSLGDTPWNCTCSIRDIANWIRHNERVILDRDNVLCHSPVHQLLRTIGSLRDEEFNFCDATRATLFKSSYIPTQNYLHEPPKPFHTISTSGPTSFVASRTTPPMTTSTTTQRATQQVTISTTTPTTKPSTLHTTVQTPTTTVPKKFLLITKTSSADYMSPPFYDTLVLEEESEFVHHNHHRGWVYVWFLPSDTALAGFLMFSHILLVASGLILIIAAMYGMYRLNKTMDELKAECAHTPG